MHTQGRDTERERDSTKMHSVKKEMEAKDSNKAIIVVTKLLNYWAEKHTCQPIQFTDIKYSFFIILGGYGHIGKWIQENVIFMRFCCCFKLSKKIEKLLNEQPIHAITKCTLTGLMH